MTNPILQMTKLKLKEVKKSKQTNHSLNLNPGLLIPNIMCPFFQLKTRESDYRSLEHGIYESS